MDSELLSFVYQLVQPACQKETNIFGYGIWSHHIRPMLDIAVELAPLHNAETELMLLSVLLHDYAGITDAKLIEEHHIHGAREASRLLSSRSFPPERITIVEDAIRSHRGSVPVEKRSNEARCLADCDAIAHIQQILR